MRLFDSLFFVAVFGECQKQISWVFISLTQAVDGVRVAL